MVVDTKEIADKQKALVNVRRKRKDEKKSKPFATISPFSFQLHLIS